MDPNNVMKEESGKERIESDSEQKELLTLAMKEKIERKIVEILSKRDKGKTC